MDNKFQSSTGEGYRLSSLSSSASTERMSAAELRAKRLAALTNGNGSSSSTTTATAPTQTHQSSTNNHNNKNIHIQTNPISSQFLSNFNSIMWDNNNTTFESDQKRWWEQGIHTNLLFNKNTFKNQHEEKSHDSWGLLQTLGGPCGILASIQAELITNLNVYDYLTKTDTTTSTTIATAINNNDNNTKKTEEDYFNKVDIEKGLANCIAIILVRACLASSVYNKNDKIEYCIDLILPKINMCHKDNVVPIHVDPLSMLECISITYDNKNKNGTGSTPEAKRMKQNSNNNNGGDNIIDDGDEKEEIKNVLINAVVDYLLGIGGRKRMECFYHNGGVMLFTMSLVATRGVDRIKSGKLHNRIMIHLIIIILYSLIYKFSLSLIKTILNETKKRHGCWDNTPFNCTIRSFNTRIN